MRLVVRAQTQSGSLEAALLDAPHPVVSLGTRLPWLQDKPRKDICCNSLKSYKTTGRALKKACYKGSLGLTNNPLLIKDHFCCIRFWIWSYGS